MSAIITAIGSSNQYYNPGTRWASLGAQTGLSFTPVAFTYNGSTWCAVGDYGVAAISSNFTTWTSSSTGASDSVVSVAASNSTFCILYNFSRVYTSSDGINWTSQTGLRSVWGTGSNGVSRIVWTGTYFVALGTNGRAARSTDGVTWTNITTLSATSWGTAAPGILFWNSPNLYAVTYIGSGSAVSTDQGATWTYSSNLGSVFSGSYTSSTPQSMVYANGKLVITGSGYVTGPSYYAMVATGTDGLTWTDKTFACSSLSGWSSNTVPYVGVSDRRKVVIFGANNTGTSPNRCAISNDGGSTWRNNPYYTSITPSAQYSFTSVANYVNNSFYTLTTGSQTFISAP